MRLIIDLQGAQGINRYHGIGRLSRSLARAMVSAPGHHDPVLLLNEAMPSPRNSSARTFPRFYRARTSVSGEG